MAILYFILIDMFFMPIKIVPQFTYFFEFLGYVYTSFEST